MLHQNFDEEMYLEDAQAQFLHRFVPHALLFASCADLLQAFATSAMVDNMKKKHAYAIQSHSSDRRCFIPHFQTSNSVASNL